MALITVQPPAAGSGPAPAVADESPECEHLERGDILLFPQTPIAGAGDDLAWLLSRDDTGAVHKNVAYDPHRDRVFGIRRRPAAEMARLRRILRAYSSAMTTLLTLRLPRYARQWKVDVASWRPFEEEGRDLPLLQRNDLLHTDAFPSRPTNGARILRVFTNINPTRSRRWVTGTEFSSLLSTFSNLPGFPRPRPRSRWSTPVAHVARVLGMPALGRSPYDAFMLRLHDFLKRSQEFQTACARQVIEFPPQSSWVLFTDAVPHAAVRGRFALEQTYIVPHSAMVSPERAPLSLLEQWFGGCFTDSEP